ncbi:ABC transporter ATP-binding protein [Lentibacillus kapialis]|uniref:ABC transporter ATP-binding protein n=1 Tax=Lentibacillus kapialis TaxID=340214 RepID=A0A917Q2H9_9BACI|nr:ATP-binding cassette domain-containing protein [Lentibacillus kapialis]GGK07412.1 ABC transporter ATP-binding protein [Lentibacillus kapialis]
MDIEIKNLHHTYSKASEAALKDVSITLESGNINVILGLNGAGKTTLFDLIAGVIPRPSEITGIKKSDNILYQVQGMGLLPTLKGRDVARLILKSDFQFKGQSLTYETLLNPDSDENEIKKSQRVWDMELGKMSPGERRWLMISSFCKIDRKVYIFDEPTSGVDPNSKISILNQIKNLSHRIVVLSTHNLHDLEQINGNIFLLHEGEIIFRGNYDEFLTKGGNKDPNVCFKNLTN